MNITSQLIRTANTTDAQAELPFKPNNHLHVEAVKQNLSLCIIAISFRVIVQLGIKPENHLSEATLDLVPKLCDALQLNKVLANLSKPVRELS